MYVITLSAIPSRFERLQPVLEALVGQNAPADRVILYIPKRYRRFPDYDGSLPQVPPGVEIRQTDEDYGPASKVLHAIKDFRDEPETDILFCDDDCIYLPDWSERFLKARQKHPDNALCTSGWNLPFFDLAGDPYAPRPRAISTHRYFNPGYTIRKLGTMLRTGRTKLGRHEKPWRNQYLRSGYVDVVEGIGGVMVQPRFFSDEVFDIPKVLWAVDDVWLSGCAMKNGHSGWAISHGARYLHTQQRHVDALNQAVIDDANRYEANRQCALYMKRVHGIWGGVQAGDENLDVA